MGYSTYEVQWVGGNPGQLRTETVVGHGYNADDRALTIYRDDEDEPLFTLSGLPYIIRRMDE